MPEEEKNTVSTQTFGTVIAGMVSAALALNGFMWSNVQSLRERNLVLQGEIQTLEARQISADEVVSIEEHLALVRLVDDATDDLRLYVDDLRSDTDKDYEAQRELVITNTKTLLVMCAHTKVPGLDCTK